MKFHFKRSCAVLLVLCMVFSMLPVMASAATYDRTLAGPATIGATNTTVDYDVSYDVTTNTITVTASETAGGMDFEDWDSPTKFKMDSGIPNSAFEHDMETSDRVATLTLTDPNEQTLAEVAFSQDDAWSITVVEIIGGANYGTYYNLTVDGSTNTYLKGDTATLPALPATTEEGKTFIGWTDGAKLFIAGATIVMDQNYVLTPYYVKTAAETYLAIFVDPDGCVIDVQRTGDSGYVTEPKFPTSEKYNLNSWDTDLTAPLTEDTVVKAQGTLKTFGISWDSVEMGAATVAVDASASVGSYVEFTVTPSADHEIAAVTATAGGEAITVIAGSGVYAITMPASDVAITAYTNVNTYSVAFKADDSLVAQYQFAKGTAITAPAASEKEGYDFIGWFDAADNQLVDGTTTVAGDMEYTARYKAKEYTVNVLNGDHTTVTLAPAAGTAMHIGDLVRITVANDEGYETGYLAAVAGADSVPIICDGKDIYFLHMPASDVTIIASEEASKNAVQFIADGDLYAFEYCDSDTAPAAPEKEGYTFVGWTASDGIFYADGTAFAAIYADETYAAEFTINTYDLTYYRGAEADASEYKCFLTLPDDSVVEFYNNDATHCRFPILTTAPRSNWARASL